MPVHSVGLHHGVGKITIEELIEKWRTYPLLYNVKLDEYKDRDKKKKALDKTLTLATVYVIDQHGQLHP